MPSEPTFRRDPLRGHLALIAPGRSNRPRDETISGEKIAGECPFCPGNEKETPPPVYVWGDQPWAGRVVPNKYPAVVPAYDGVHSLGHDGPVSGETAGHGLHEVLIEGPDHLKDWNERSSSEIEMLLRVMFQRHEAHAKEAWFRYGVAFRNFGPRSGATLRHPHSQVMALPVVPPQVAEIWERQAAAFAKGDCLVCLGTDPQRLVCESDTLIAYTAWSPKAAYEVCLQSKAHRADLSGGEVMAELAIMLQRLVACYHALIPHPSYNLVIQAPRRQTVPEQHWRMELLLRNQQIAGFEMASGIYLSDITPERAALRLREVLPPRH